MQRLWSCQQVLWNIAHYFTSDVSLSWGTSLFLSPQQKWWIRPKGEAVWITFRDKSNTWMGLEDFIVSFSFARLTFTLQAQQLLPFNRIPLLFEVTLCLKNDSLCVWVRENVNEQRQVGWKCAQCKKRQREVIHEVHGMFQTHLNEADGIIFY